MFKPNQLLQHQYGGFYVFEGSALDTATGQTVAVYRHIWPFDMALYTRPFDEFMDGRFRPVTQQDLNEAQAVGVEAFSALISLNKSAKRAIWNDYPK